MPNENALTSMLTRWRLPLLVVCVGSVVTGFVLSGQEVVHDSVAIAMKMVPLAMLVFGMPWLIGRRVFGTFGSPVDAHRINRILVWLVLALSLGLFVMSLVTTAGISCEPTVSNVLATVFWGLFAASIVLFGPGFLRAAKEQYRGLARAEQRCFDCGYDLQQLTGPACPECGSVDGEVHDQPPPDPGSPTPVN